MSVSFNFSDKVVLITGSSSGIGAATAVLFSKSGAQVVVTGRNAEKVEEVAQNCQKVSSKGLSPLRVVADVGKEEDINRLVDETIKKFGRLDVLVNNAGIVDMAGVTEDKFMGVYKNVINTNLTSTVLMTHLCVQHLAKTKGNIINISSVAALLSSANISMYCMSKSAMDMFTKCMAVELGPLGIRVNSVNPGAVRTPIIERSGIAKSDSDALWDFYGSQYPVGRAGESEDIGDAILFLASDNSAFTTGTIMVVDGGHVAAGINSKSQFDDAIKKE